MYRLEVPKGSKIRLSATTGATAQVRRWDVRMFPTGALAPSSAPRLSYGSRIGGGEQRIEIPAQEIDCRLEAETSPGSAASGKWISRR